VKKKPVPLLQKQRNKTTNLNTFVGVCIDMFVSNCFCCLLDSILFSHIPSRDSSGSKMLTNDDSDSEEECNKQSASQILSDEVKQSNDSIPICKFDQYCYRTGQRHLAQYSHPQRDELEKKKRNGKEPAEKKQKTTHLSAPKGTGTSVRLPSASPSSSPSPSPSSSPSPSPSKTNGSVTPVGSPLSRTKSKPLCQYGVGNELSTIQPYQHHQHQHEQLLDIYLSDHFFCCSLFTCLF
jgi:hypothetical protein